MSGVERRRVANLCARLRARRRELGITQRALAQRLGLNNSYLSNWENGTYAPQLASLLAWAEALGWSVRVGVPGAEEEL